AEPYTLSLHDALPICFLSGLLPPGVRTSSTPRRCGPLACRPVRFGRRRRSPQRIKRTPMSKPLRLTNRGRRNRVILARVERDRRSEEHTSELQSLAYL